MSGLVFLVLSVFLFCKLVRYVLVRFVYPFQLNSFGLPLGAHSEAKVLWTGLASLELLRQTLYSVQLILFFGTIGHR